MLRTIKILVSGEVQGVFYRQKTKETATQLRINGYVMNLPDGSVEIIATGTKEQLDILTAWCHTGPPKATVTNVVMEELPLQQFDQFIIKRFYTE